jgi:hypothetical protein
MARTYLVRLISKGALSAWLCVAQGASAWPAPARPAQTSRLSTAFLPVKRKVPQVGLFRWAFCECDHPSFLLFLLLYSTRHLTIGLFRVPFWTPYEERGHGVQRCARVRRAVPQPPPYMRLARHVVNRSMAAVSHVRKVCTREWLHDVQAQ